MPVQKTGISWLPWLMLVMAIAYFVHHSMASQSGLGAYARNEVRLSVLQEQADALAKERARMAQRVALLNPDEVDPDFADELVRRSLGYSKPGEIIVPLKP
jgi:cell division protein FtsB